MKGLDATQIEQLRQISEYLSFQREQQNISLEKIANQTYIPLRVLKALDSLQLDQLPEPVYIRGFIRRYADALGLDGMEIADAFPVEPTISVSPEPDESGRSVPEAQPSTYETGRSAERSERSRSAGRPWLLAGMGAVVLVGAIALGALSLFRRPAVSPPESPTSSTTELPSEATKAPAPSDSSISASPAAITPAPKAVSPAPAAGSVSPVQANVSLTGRSWMQVMADGKTVYEGTLAQGEQRTWKAQKKLVITAGNAGVVVLSCNQEEAKPVGKTGQVVDATCAIASGNTEQTVTR